MDIREAIKDQMKMLSVETVTDLSKRSKVPSRTLYDFFNGGSINHKALEKVMIALKLGIAPTKEGKITEVDLTKQIEELEAIREGIVRKFKQLREYDHALFVRARRLSHVTWRDRHKADLGPPRTKYTDRFTTEGLVDRLTSDKCLYCGRKL